MSRNTRNNTIRRYHWYLHFLRQLNRRQCKFVSSRTLAEALNIDDIMIRKDLALTGITGGRGVGFPVPELISGIEEIIGCRQYRTAVLVGAGALGKALLNYPGFENYQVRITEVFDYNPDLIGQELCGRTVRDARHILDFLNQNEKSFDLAIICTPPGNVPTVFRELKKLRFTTFWNFTDHYLAPEPQLIIRNEQISSGLADLLYRKRLLEENSPAE